MDVKQRIRRYAFFLLGLFINSFGVSFVTKAALGTSPISSVPYALSLGFKPTLGMFTLYMSIVLIILQMIILRRKFPKEYFLQIPASILFSYFIDFTMMLLENVNPASYALKLIMLLLGCAILGVGVFMEVVANVVMLPGESFVNAVSKTFHTDFGKTKIAFDSTITVIAVGIGLAFYHRIAGVREGTVIAAILVGGIARFLKHKLGFVEEKWLIRSADMPITATSESDLAQSKTENIILTIGREYGSGGRRIARRIAGEFGLAIHDDDILEYVSSHTHIDKKIVKMEDQKLRNKLLYDFVAQVYDQSDEADRQERIFKSEREIIEKFANEGNCVILGRCADWVLRKRSNTHRIFLYAEEQQKIEEIQKRYQISQMEAKKMVKEINRERATHYHYFTGRHWGQVTNYDLCINTATVSEEDILEMVRRLINK